MSNVKTLFAALSVVKDPLDMPAREYCAVAGQIYSGGRVGYRLEGVGGAKDVLGAWGVSVDVHGAVPSDLAGQAVQATKIYRSQVQKLVKHDGSVADCDRAVLAWWRPWLAKGTAPIPANLSHAEKCKELLGELNGENFFQRTPVSKLLIYGLVAAVAGYLLWKVLK